MKSMCIIYMYVFVVKLAVYFDFVHLLSHGTVCWFLYLDVPGTGAYFTSYECLLKYFTPEGGT